jgi:hypothetical protein
MRSRSRIMRGRSHVSAILTQLAMVVATQTVRLRGLAAFQAIASCGLGPALPVNTWASCPLLASPTASPLVYGAIPVGSGHS